MAESQKADPLRLNAKLYEALAAWAEDDFRSVNGQIEYLLTECVRQRKRTAARGQALQKRRWYIGREDDYDSRYGTRASIAGMVFSLVVSSHFP